MDMSSTQIPVVLVQRSETIDDDRPVPLRSSVGHGKEPDFVRVSLPTQKVTRDQGGWLYHRCIMVHCEVFLQHHTINSHVDFQFMGIRIDIIMTL